MTLRARISGSPAWPSWAATWPATWPGTATPSPCTTARPSAPAVLVAEHGDEGTFIPSESMADFVASPGPAAGDHRHGQGRRPDRRRDRRAGPAARRRRHRRSTAATPTSSTPAAARRRCASTACTSSAAACPAARRARCSGRRIMPGGSAESYAEARADLRVDRGPGRRHAVLRARRPGRRRPLREDGAQRHRVRRHAAHRRGLRPAAHRARRDAGRDRRASSATWNEGDLESFLIEITADVLAQVDAATGQPFVDIVLDQAEQKGTGRWTVQSALDLGIPITGIAEATFARSLSGHADQRAAARDGLRRRRSSALGCRRPRRLRRGRAERAVRVEGGRLRPGLRPHPGRQRRVRLGHRPRRDGHDLARRLHHPGPLPRTGSARPTTAGPEPAVAAGRALLRARPSTTGVGSWRRVVSAAALAGIPTPAFSSSLAYYDGLRRDRLPAALIQGLRDNFGAHTYRRVDRDGSVPRPSGPATSRSTRPDYPERWPPPLRPGRQGRAPPGHAGSSGSGR